MNRRQILWAIGSTTLALPLAGLAPRIAAAQDTAAEADPERGLLPNDRTMGDPDAPDVLIEYASLSCPHCASFHKEILPTLKSDYIDTGKLLYVYRDFPLNRTALWGAMTANCLEGQRYWSFLNVLYDQQRSWAFVPRDASDSQALGPLYQLAQLAGFSEEKFLSCLEDEATFERLVSGIQYAEDTYGIDATPTIIVNNEKLRFRSPEDFFEQLGEELQGS